MGRRLKLLLLLFSILGILYFHHHVTDYHKKWTKDVAIQDVIGEIFTEPLPNVTNLFYNRIPKTGSTALMTMLERTAAENDVYVKVLHYYGHGFGFSSDEERIQFVKDFSSWPKIKGKSLVIKHQLFLHFDRFHGRRFRGLKSTPMYINQVRSPDERFVSFYNYMRFRPDRPKQIPDNIRYMSVNDCINTRHVECSHPNYTMVTVQFFCGEDPVCLSESSDAVQIAKLNIAKHYVTVGLLERQRDVIQVLEHLLPQYFKNLTQLYDTFDKRNTTISNATLRKTVPGNKELIKLKDLLKYDFEIYEFVKQRFARQYTDIFSSSQKIITKE